MRTTATISIICSILFGVLIGASDVVDDRMSSTGGTNEGTRQTFIGPKRVGHPSFMSPHESPIAIHGDCVFVVNTPADTVDVIDAKTRAIVHRVSVGIDPVSIAVRPDGKEVWVANHISDSVSVIDSDPESLTYLQVVATVQEFDRRTRATRFDEPVGIAFASNQKAYVALSSENQIAVIDVPTRKVKKRLGITAQDPRAITVRGNRLYVIPFESNNKTQLSGGSKDDIDGQLVTFDAWDHSVANNNVLSLGHVVDIVKHPEVPDRDLFVFDTETDELVEVVDTLGTLLYGLAVDSKGRVFVAQTDARNDANGRAGTKDQGLGELENRAFLNQITVVDFNGSFEKPKPDFFNLEPLPPEHPEPGEALATPFAIQVSNDDKTLVVSAAGSDKLFTVDADTGKVLGRVDVDSVPRGIALESETNGKPSRAWVHNAVANSVSLVGVSDPAAPILLDTIQLEDPTHPVIKRGRKVFNTGSASTTGTFSCASCHPDGHTDQLLWVLKTPVVTGGDQIMPRSTMPIRGLRDTAPFHWDGIPGDPYGGNNSANVYAHVEPNSDLESPESTTRHLIDGALASTMSMVGNEETNDEGQTGALSAAERDDLAKFLLAVPYPPAQRRAYTNVLSRRARTGFELFHIKGDNDPTKINANVCGDCHRMPHLVSTNTPGTGMDAPTWRGAYDRWLILPQGRLNIIEFDFFRRVAEDGLDERRIWQFSWAGRRRFDPVWNMVLEGSTGFSGAFARQLTINTDTAADESTGDLLDALELSASEDAIVLQVDGVFVTQQNATPVVMQYDAGFEGGKYIKVAGTVPDPSSVDSDKADGHVRHGTTERAYYYDEAYSRKELLALAFADSFIGTFTAHHGANDDYEHPQPVLWAFGPIEQQRGHQEFPFLYEGKQRMTISGRHIDESASVLVDGRCSDGTLEIDGETICVELERLPPAGIHMLQVQNPDGLFSNDFIFHVTEDAESGEETRRRIDRDRTDARAILFTAISKGDLEEVKQLVQEGADVNGRHPESGDLPLSTAALYGHVRVAEYLLEQEARVSGTNRDGNTPLHVAAFLCRFDMVELLLENGASVTKTSNRRETPVNVVSGQWSEGLAGFYRSIASSSGFEIDLDQIERDRPRMTKLLGEYGKK